MSGGLKVALVVGAAILALGSIFYATNRNDGAGDGRYAFAVGNPGPGAAAPPIRLSSTDGTTFDLSAYRGQAVLLYFQEGVGCQPCWDQINDIEATWGEFQAQGIDSMVTITSDPLDVLKQKVADENIGSPVLSDSDLAVSKTYEANRYGMMGASKDGHSFVLVDKDGVIVWRADYGGAPNYTMRVPVERLVADIRMGLGSGPVS